MFKNIPFNRVEWVTSGFLIFTAILTVTAVPYYLWTYGWDWFLFGVSLFLHLHWYEYYRGIPSTVFPQSISGKMAG